MEALITAASSSLHSLIIQSESIRARASERGRDGHARECAHRTKRKLNSAATLTRLPNGVPAKISIARVIPLNECTF